MIIIVITTILIVYVPTSLVQYTSIYKDND